MSQIWVKKGQLYAYPVEGAERLFLRARRFVSEHELGLAVGLLMGGMASILAAFGWSMQLPGETALVLTLYGFGCLCAICNG